MTMNAFERWLISGMLAIVASVCGFFFSVVFTDTSRLSTVETQVSFLQSQISMMQAQHAKIVEEFQLHRRKTEAP
jgi:Tfp pilus assembly protein PilN